MSNQLVLPIGLPDDARFANFLTEGDSARAQAVNLLHRVNEGEPSFLYLWGGSGSGLSHLLQAAGNDCGDAGGTVQYLPLDQLLDYAPADVLAELEHLDVVCLDQLHSVCGNAAWEQALFHFYNLQRAAGGQLLVAANCAPRELKLNLEDLRSRLAAGVVMHLPDYSDAQKMAILQFRAAQLGLDLAAEPARLILHRAARSMGALIACLQQLDRAAFAQRRKPTVPFIKQVFGW